MTCPAVSSRPPIALVDADPDLEAVVAPEDRERARREVLARVARLSPGRWDVAAHHEPDRHHRGFLVLDGLLSREVEVLGRRCVELIRPGDVLRPWQWDQEGSHVRAEIGWQVLEPTDLHNVEAFCAAYGRWRIAEREVAQNGITVPSPMGGLVKNPAVTVINEALRQMAMFGALLGLDQAGRVDRHCPGIVAGAAETAE